MILISGNSVSILVILFYVLLNSESALPDTLI